MARHVLTVFTNAQDGRDDEFNEWYSNRHLQDLLRVPGIVAAQRFRHSSVQRSNPPYPWRYLAIYEIETDDLAGTIAEITRRSGTDAMVLSDALAPERQGFVFDPITPRVTRPADASIDRI